MVKEEVYGGIRFKLQPPKTVKNKFKLCLLVDNHFVFVDIVIV